MRAAYWMLLALCIMTVLNVALVDANMYLDKRPFDAVSILVSLTLVVGAMIVGARSCIKLSALRNKRKTLPTVGAQSPRNIRLLFLYFTTPPAVMGLFFLIVGLRSGEFLSYSPVSIIFFGLVAFLVMRYVAVRRKHGLWLNVHYGVDQFLAGVFGPRKSALIWFAGTVAFAFAVALVPQIIR